MPDKILLQDLDDKDKDDAERFNIAPRVMTEYRSQDVRKYQLRAYIYQARGLLGADPTGYSDPYARIVFGNRSGVTGVIKQTCSPMWDTSVILDNIEICRDPNDLARCPPDVIIEVFDEDPLVSLNSYYQYQNKWYCSPLFLCTAITLSSASLCSYFQCELGAKSIFISFALC